MKKEVKKKWVAALRSGKYKQAKGALRSRNGYCCLGVLCDLYLKEKKEKWVRVESQNYYKIGEDESAVLPREVMKWAGLTSVNPEAGPYHLAHWNDDGHVAFPEIADIISAKL